MQAVPGVQGTEPSRTTRRRPSYSPLPRTGEGPGEGETSRTLYPVPIRQRPGHTGRSPLGRLCPGAVGNGGAPWPQARVGSPHGRGPRVGAPGRGPTCAGWPRRARASRSAAGTRRATPTAGVASMISARVEAAARSGGMAGSSGPLQAALDDLDRRAPGRSACTSPRARRPCRYVDVLVDDDHVAAAGTRRRRTCAAMQPAWRRVARVALLDRDDDHQRVRRLGGHQTPVTSGTPARSQLVPDQRRAQVRQELVVLVRRLALRAAQDDRVVAVVDRLDVDRPAPRARRWRSSRSTRRTGPSRACRRGRCSPRRAISASAGIGSPVAAPRTHLDRLAARRRPPSRSSRVAVGEPSMQAAMNSSGSCADGRPRSGIARPARSTSRG